jgi:hypothetical protein
MQEGLSAAEWLDAIKSAQSRDREYIDRGKNVVRRYRDDDRGRGKAANVSRYNILYSITETLKPILFSRLPEPDVRRRFKNESEVERQTAEILEKVLSYVVDAQDFYSPIEDAVEDYVLPGMGIVRVKFNPTFKTEEEEVEVEPSNRIPPVLDQLGNIIENEVVEFPEGTEVRNGMGFGKNIKEEQVFEEVELEYVGWTDWTHADEKVWSSVGWIAYKGLLTRKEVKEEFPGFEDKVPYTANIDDDNKKKKTGRHQKLAEIWEVWDKENEEVKFVAVGYPDEFLEEGEGLGLRGFYPSPKPLFAVTTNDTLTPVPFYIEYQDQALELDRVTQRINKLIEEVKIRGIYDSAVVDFPRIFKAGDNEFVPVEDLRNFNDKGGANGIYQALDIQPTVSALINLYEERNQLLAIIDNVAGVSDILRSQTNPNEGVGTNQIKANFATLRTSTKQREVQRFIRDTYRLVTEVIAENFRPETLELISGQEMSLEIIDLMRSQDPFAFKIDIETDATVAVDAAQEQDQAIELITAVASFVDVMPKIAATAGTTVAQQLAKIVVGSLKGGRQIEQALEDSFNNPPAPQPPSAEEQLIQLETQKLQLQAQKDQADMSVKIAELELKQQELNLKAGQAVDESQNADIDQAIKVAKLKLEEQKIKIEGADPSKNVVVGV